VRILAAIIIAVALLGLGLLLCWPSVALYSAKKAALRDFADARAELNILPTEPPKVIRSADGFTNRVTVEVAGCTLSLPSDTFVHDPNPKHWNVVLNHSRYRMLIFSSSMDTDEWNDVMKSVGQTNRYEYVRSIYNATERGISKQRDMDALLRHVILLKAKLMISPPGFEESCIEFDRGDLKGFIIGDPTRQQEPIYPFLRWNLRQVFRYRPHTEGAPSDVGNRGAHLTPQDRN